MIASDFIKGYITCALWSSTDEHGEPLDSVFSADDLSTEALARIQEDCNDFLQANAHDLSLFKTRYTPKAGFSPDECAGHDFWLTRNGHGAGFWDRGLGELGDRLTQSAKAHGSCDIYAGDDGWLYIS